MVVKVVRQLTRKDVFLDLLLINKEGLMSGVAIGGSLSHGDHEAIKYKISANRSKSDRKPSVLDMRGEEFRLLRNQWVRSPGKILLDMLVPISAGHYLNPISKSHSIAKTGNSKTLEVKQTRQKAGLVEQRSLFEGKKEGVCPQ